MFKKDKQSMKIEKYAVPFSFFILQFWFKVKEIAKKREREKQKNIEKGNILKIKTLNQKFRFFFGLN